MLLEQCIARRTEDIYAEAEEGHSLGTILGGDADNEPTSLQRVDLLTQREVGEMDGGAPSSPAGVGGPTSDANLEVGTNHEYLPLPTVS